jgi:hypothetical protein
MNKFRYTIHCTDQAGRRTIEVALPQPITGWRHLAVIEQHLRQRLGDTTLTVVSHTPHTTPQSGPNSDHSGQGQHREPTGTRPGTGGDAAAAQRPAAANTRRGAATNRTKPNGRTRTRLRRIGNRLFLAGLVLALLAGNLLPALLHVSPNLLGGVVFHVLTPAVFLTAGAAGAARCYTWSDRWATGRRYRSTTNRKGW